MQQLPDHMIADRCQGAAEEGCMQIQQRTKKECQRRKTVKGQSLDNKHGGTQETRKKRKERKEQNEEKQQTRQDCSGLWRYNSNPSDSDYMNI